MTVFTATLRRRAAATVATFAVAGGLFTAAGPAAASPSDPTGQQGTLASSYSSLSGALISFYAKEQGTTLTKYVAEQKTLLGLKAPTLPGGVTPSTSPSPDPSGTTSGLPTAPASPPMPAGPGPSGTPGVGSTATAPSSTGAGALADLNAQLAQSGLTLDTSGYTSLQALANDVVAKSGTPDGAVTLAGAKWMASLANLRAPKLKTPSAGQVALPSIPKSALIFGLLGDKALSTLITDQPNLFAAVGKNGLGTKALQSAWGTALSKAFTGSQQSLTKALPDPCTGAMLAVMATGSPSSASQYGSCAPACVTGGLYLNSQTLGLFSPGSATTASNPYSSVWSATTLNGLQSWQQQILLNQNPSLSQQLAADNNPSSSQACSASSTATSNALNSTLPGIFGQLQTK